MQKCMSVYEIILNQQSFEVKIKKIKREKKHVFNEPVVYYI